MKKTDVVITNRSELETKQNDKKIVCEKCRWSWDLSEGGDDPYTCHKCGNENHKSELTEKCWKGYTQKGMKTMFGKKYPNCVKNKKSKTNLQEQISRIQSMMGLVNESGLTFLRRQQVIKELIDSGIKTILDNDNICDYYAGSFLEEVQWQVTDNWEKLGLPKDLDIAIVHDWVEDNFGDYIENEYYKYEDIMCNGDPYDVR